MFKKIKNKLKAEIDKDVSIIIKVGIIVGLTLTFFFLTIIGLLILIVMKLY